MVHVSWSKEVLKNDPVVPAAVSGNAASMLDVNSPGRGADHNRQEFIDLDDVGQECWVELSSSFECCGG